MGKFVPHIEVQENNSCRIKGTLKDENDVVIGSGSISLATLAIENMSDGTVIRAAADISADITVAGVLNTAISGAENAMVDETAIAEYHVATMTINGTSGDGKTVNFVREVYIKVGNQRTV